MRLATMFVYIRAAESKKDNKEGDLHKSEESVHDSASSRREELNEAYRHEGKEANEPHEAAVWFLVRMDRDQSLSTNLQTIRP
jgi:hypothetical protein